MLKRLVVLLALAAILAGTAEAVTIDKGKRGRRVLRHLALVQYLENDKLRVYEEYGYPVHRLRVLGYGRVLEHWRYYELGVEFVFDDDANLVETNRFMPENRRERIDAFPGY